MSLSPIPESLVGAAKVIAELRYDIEFDDALRLGDGLADVAFLAMDLERLGRPDLAGRIRCLVAARP